MSDSLWGSGCAAGSCGRAGMSRIRRSANMLRMAGTIATAITWRNDSPASSRARAISGPITAPSESMKRWNPNTKPVRDGSLESRSSASRGAVRIPLPVRSTTRAPITQPQAGATATSGLATFDSV